MPTCKQYDDMKLLYGVKVKYILYKRKLDDLCFSSKINRNLQISSCGLVPMLQVQLHFVKDGNVGTERVETFGKVFVAAVNGVDVAQAGDAGRCKHANEQ